MNLLKKATERPLYEFFFAVFFIYFATLALMYFKQRDIQYFPSNSGLSASQYADLGITPINTETDDGLSLSGWYFPAKTPLQGAVSPLVVLFHGNAADGLSRAFRAKPFIDNGFGLLIVEYRGFGGNEGSPSEDGLYRDSEAWLDWAHEKGYQDKDIIFFGVSIGTGVATEMAFRHPDVKALVLESSMYSALSLAQERYWMFPSKYLMKDQFLSDEKIPSIHIPILFLHGEKDKIISMEHSKRLYKIANEPKKLVLIPEAGHNDMFYHGDSLRILHFLNGLSAANNQE